MLTSAGKANDAGLVAMHYIVMHDETLTCFIFSRLNSLLQQAT